LLEEVDVETSTCRPLAALNDEAYSTKLLRVALDMFGTSTAEEDDMISSGNVVDCNIELLVECVLILCGKVWNVGTLLLVIENFVMGENEVAIKLFVDLVQINKANNVMIV